MNSGPDAKGILREQANTLYWTSDDTVDQVASQLGVSRNTLYSLVQPWPAGAPCPECGELLVFANRSSRDAGRTACEACGVEREIGTVGLADTAEPRAGHEHPPHGRGGGERGGCVGRWREELTAVQPERVVLIGGAATLGVVLGAVAAKMVRDR